MGAATVPDRVVGVDVSVRRGLDVVVLERRTCIVESRSALTPDDLEVVLRRYRPACVAVDSPPGPGREPGSTSRACERALRSSGVHVFLTPSDPDLFAGPFYDWIRVGMRAFAAAAAAGYPPQVDARIVRGHALEVYPHATDVVLRGRLPPLGTTRRRDTRRAWRSATLEQAGVRTDGLCRDRAGQPTLDSIDAALAALTAREALEGNFSALGAAGEWLVVPTVGPNGLARRA